MVNWKIAILICFAPKFVALIIGNWHAKVVYKANSVMVRGESF